MTANANIIIAAVVKTILDEEIAERDVIWKAFADRTEKIEDKFKPPLRTAFTKQEKAVISAMVGKPVPDTSNAEKAVQKQESDAAEAAAETYVNGIFKLSVQIAAFEKVALPFITTAYKSGGQAAFTEIGMEAAFNVTNPRAKKILKERTFKFAKEVNETTQKKLRKTLAKGFDKGEGIPQLSQRVAKVFDIRGGAETDRIARTEVIGASNQGTFQGYTESGLVDTKIWVDSRDDKVRTSPHNHAIDGQERKLTARFSNGLLHPHDPGGAAGNVINCRCTISAGKLKEAA